MKNLLLGFILVFVGHGVSADNGTWTMIDSGNNASFADVPDGTIVQFEAKTSVTGQDGVAVANVRATLDVASLCALDSIFIREITPTRLIVVCELRRRRFIQK